MHTIPYQESIFAKINQTESLFPDNKNLIDIFQSNLLEFRDNVAVCDGELKLTYQQLDFYSDVLAGRLFSILKDNDQVSNNIAIIGDYGVKNIISIFAVLKLGLSYLPIDSSNPAERIESILSIGQVKFVINNSQNENNLINKSGHMFFQFSLAELNQEQKIEYKNIGIKNDIAYIMFTSGTTGLAKGVMVSHKSILRLVINTNYISIRPSDTLLQTGTISFDASTFEIWGTLLSGAKLVCVSKSSIMNTRDFDKHLKMNNVNVLWLTTSLFNFHVDNDRQMNGLELFSNLDYLLFGGEKASAYHVKNVKEKYKTLNLINFYGPTENTTFSTFYPIKEGFENNLPIGKPISNSTVFVFNEDKLAGPEEDGEICVGGQGLANGYLNDTKLTEKRFVDNPVLPGTKMYRTGDMGKINQNGNIVFLGRLDNQIKIRGFRVELEEIENCINTFTGISNSVVVFNDSNVENKFLACFYTVDDNDFILADLKKYLNHKLPEYMIPSLFECLEEIPLNANGKIDRNSLKQKIQSQVPKKEATGPESENKNDAKGFVLNLIQNYMDEISSDIVVKNDTELMSLGLNSLQYVKILIEIETEYEFEFSDDKINVGSFGTVQEIIDYANEEIVKNPMVV